MAPVTRSRSGGNIASQDKEKSKGSKGTGGSFKPSGVPEHGTAFNPETVWDAAQWRMYAYVAIFQVTAIAALIWLGNLGYVDKIDKKLTTFGVFPDVLDRPVGRPFPTTYLVIKYNGRIFSDVENIGREYHISEVAPTPGVIIRGVEGLYYTLVMTDPDDVIVGMPTGRERLMWLITDIPGDSDGFSENLGTTLLNYTPPAPETGRHRYVFILYMQDEKGVVEKAPNEIDGFSSRDFLSKHKLTPVSATMFYLSGLLKTKSSKRSASAAEGVGPQA